jgi:peptidoglycan/xylan/chitin deacetylase (PgdA/CDA1 family)
MPWNKTPEELIGKLKNYIQKSEENLVLILHRIGQEAVNWARENGSYTDRTGNLRNSIGYVIFKDGADIAFKGNQPAQQNKDLIIRLVKGKIPAQGYALVVYAGMEYGIYVEAKGYIVLSGALENSITAKALDQALKKVKA